MKFFIAIFLLVICTQATNAQTDQYINNDDIKKEIEKGTGITTETLCNSKWIVNTSILQAVYDDPSDNMILDMEYTSSYVFNEDGTFKVSATIDSDGKWELRNNGKLLYLYNNLRDDEEFHHLLMDGNTMKWFVFEGKTLFYQYLSPE